MKPKYIIIGSSVLLTGTIVFLIVNKIHKKKLLDKVDAILNDPTGVFGSIQDLAAPGNAFDPNFYKTQNIPIYATAITTAEYQIKNAVNTFSANDQNAMISAVTGMGTKAKVSELASYFEEQFGQSLISFLQAHMDPSQLQVLQNAIQKMPTK